jgi:2-methylcitrate dehydratase PrpD
MPTQLTDVHKGSHIGSSFWGSNVHPSIPVITPAFAIAERERSTGQELITAIILGYEVMIRIAEAVFPSHHSFWNPTGTCGTFAAAITAGKLLKLNQFQMSAALGIAGLQASGLWEGISQGAICSEFISGKASMNGIIAALLAQKGLPSPKEIFEGKQGFFRATTITYDTNKILHKIDSCLSNLKIMDTSFKIYPSCGHTHSAIDAILRIRKEYDGRTSNINKIDIKLYPRAIEFLNGIKPDNPHSAKFSLHFCIAAALEDGTITLETFSPERLKNGETKKLMKKITVKAENEFGKCYPEKWITSAEMITNDGQKASAKIEYPKGHPNNPLTKEEIINKFFEVINGCLSRDQSDKLKNNILNLEKVGDMSDFLATCDFYE